eukprot:2469882-Alexandrium_andersonii.AAC.1
MPRFASHGRPIRGLSRLRVPAQFRPGAMPRFASHSSPIRSLCVAPRTPARTSPVSTLGNSQVALPPSANSILRHA